MNILLNTTYKNYIEYTYHGKTKKIYGGSFFECPHNDHLFSINLMAEYPLSCDKYIPIKDFSVPDGIKSFLDTFETILSLEKKDVYVGCFGGIGRTGLFMACFLKYLGVENPINKVRNEYHERAIETPIQLEYLKRFPKKYEISNFYKFK